FGEPLHLSPECEQGAQAAVSRVVKIAGDEKEIRFRVDRVIDNAVQGAKSRVLKLLPQLRRDFPYAPKRAIEMQVCRMDKSQTLHAFGCIGYTGQIRGFWEWPLLRCRGGL